MAKTPHPAAQLALKEPDDAEPMETETEGVSTPETPPQEHQAEPRELTDEDLEPGWSLMASAPTSGKPVQLAGLLYGIPLICAAYMHSSRRYMGSASRWVEFAEWRVLNTPDKVPFEPLAWSRYE